MKTIFSFLIFHFLFLIAAVAQENKTFTHADTLRGSITPERAWWNVLRYDITVKPDYNSKTIVGICNIEYKVIKILSNKNYLQIDLQSPLKIDSFSIDKKSIYTESSMIVNYATENFITKIDSSVWYLVVGKEELNSMHSITIYYHGTPREAVRPPWDGGWIWKKDDKGRPWMSVACEGLGASVWYPCKDHLSDEPDNGASLSIIVPDTLMAVGNGRLTSTQKNSTLR